MTEFMNLVFEKVMRAHCSKGRSGLTLADVFGPTTILEDFAAEVLHRGIAFPFFFFRPYPAAPGHAAL